MVGHSGLDWNLGRGGKGIDGDRFDIGGLTDLSFFTLSADLENTIAGGPFEEDRGVNCFGNAGDPFYPQAGIRKGRGGRADTSFWFTGDTAVGGIPVLYALFGFGQFKNPDPDPDSDLDPNWPPRLVGESTLLAITDWVLTVENEGDVVNNLSCIGEGKFADYFPGGVLMNILVTREQ